MIVGNTTLLVGIEKKDFEFLYESVNDPEQKTLTGTLFPVSEYEHEKWILSRNTSDRDKMFIILDRDTKEKVGSIGIKNIDYINSNAELYIRISSKFTGTKGYGTSAINSLVNFCFNRMNLHKIYLQVFESNDRAVKCYQKCGFRIEGKLREHHFDDGRYSPVLIMGIIRKDLDDV